MSRSAIGPPGSGTLSMPLPAPVRPGALSQVLHELQSQPEADPTVAWPLALEAGSVIGRFELLREIGKGGFGVVYEARDRELGRSVAFKAVRPGPRQEIRAERLIREAETAARLSHPNIVTLFDVGRAAEGPYLVMELLRGATLAHRLRHELHPLRETLRIAVEIAQGLSHAHAHGVIHRDLTPGNVFLCDDGQVKLLDLGLAHAFGHRKIDGGTPTYMAPEQQRGAPEDERTDVYALGVILFQMLAGELPSTGEPATEPATAPMLDVPELPPLADLVAQMLSVDPVKRPRDASEALSALAELQHELHRAQPGPARARPAAHRRPFRRSSGEHGRPERTWVCSVVTVDIVRYFDQSVELQAQWKERFNGYLARAVQEVPEADRVILDSGGGVAVCFLGDPDGAMSCALGLLGAVVGEQGALSEGMRVRIGIHLGAVKLVKDINGNLNALGDGLHVAQRMMGFAGENQILTSRSFHDVASCLAESYRPLFNLAGIRRDEQMREHAVYQLHLPKPVSGDPQGARTAEVIETGPARTPGLDPTAEAAIENRAAGILGPIAHHLARTIGARASTARELGETLAAYMPVSGDRDAFLRSCSAETQPVSGPTLSPASAAFTAEVLERAGRQLAEYLGPMAKILVSRTSAKARSEEELYDLLAAEIDSGPDRAAFRRKGPSAHQLR
ncbi:MAG: protein kinase domain-containing protein [Myxococcales bacterium]